MLLFFNSSKSEDEIFFIFTDTLATILKLYGINVKTGEMNYLGKLPEAFMPTAKGIRVIGSTYYYDCVHYDDVEKTVTFKLFSNENPIENPNSWEEVKFTKRYYMVSFINLQDKSYLINAYDSLSGRGALWFAKLKKPSAVSEEIETQPTIYISEPMPNPASDIVKFNVYYNKTYSMEQADIKIYDIMGRVVSAADEFITDSRNEYSSMVRWNSSGVSPGVYFIGIRLGGETITKPVVIYR
jgi:hypothetical protein